MSIGFDGQSVARILKRYSPEQIQLWSDVTLAAMERKDPNFFRRSPQAYFMDNIKNAAECGRTPPDWFWVLRKEEDRRRARFARSMRECSKSDVKSRKSTPILPVRAFSVDTNATSVVAEMTAQFCAAGQSAEDAKRNAERFAAQFSNHQNGKSSRR